MSLRSSIQSCLMLTSALVLLFFPIAQTNAVAYPDYRYVAMGDSVAAGLGLGTATTDCGRSTEAYSTAIADYYSIRAENIACSGAKADEGIYDEQETADGEVIDAQLDTAFAGGTPDLITLTIGANDLRWTQFIRQCAVLRCGGSFDDARAAAYLTDLRIELWWTLREIERRSAGSPPLVALSGYYQPFASGGECSDRQGITDNEAAWLNRQATALSNVIRSEANRQADFALYVPADFSGHELCSGDSWIQTRNDPAPFHPTAAGQQALADSFIEAFERD